MGAERAEKETPSVPQGAIIAGRYRVVAHLGRGGMGSVFRVVEVATGRPLALKQIALPAGASARKRASARLAFRREFHTLVRLKHPRIVEAYEYGLDVAAGRGAGEPYYTMELLEGSDLFAHKRGPIDTACRLLRDVAAALAFLHSRRLVHRDVSPGNVRCTTDGRAKLIDFGVLSTAGHVGNLAGTPPLMAPEALRGVPLDHKVDLYGLGALAYWLVTGQHAYPAREPEQLEDLWRVRPRAPRELRPDVPEALDALIVALLSLESLARPSTAAEVIERLGAIAGLEPAPEIEAAKGYLASAALVGRHREMEQLRRSVEKTLGKDGQAVLIEAPSGTGKSRLLRELALEAQISGVVVASVGSDEAGRGPYGSLRALGRGLLAAAPVEASDAARPHAPVIARVIPEVASRLGPIQLAPLGGDPAEDRMRLQAELAAWIVDLAKARPIALLVDDVQRCDEASAAVLAALSHEAGKHRLLVGFALRTDETVRAPSAVAAMRDAGARIRLRGLDAKEVEELCHALFGDAPNLARLAQWMHRAAGGSPLHSTELARHLVDRGTVRYVDGIWVVPEDFAREDLPAGLAEAMDARIAALRPGARALAEALSVHGGELPLDLCLRVSEGKEDAEVFAALDELRFQEILIGTEESVRFRHDSLREALLRGLGDERKRHLHRVVGEALSAEGPVDPEREAEVGWHLLRGGDAPRGGALLERAGRRLYQAQSFSDAVAPLEAALEVHEQRRGSPRVRIELKHMLLMAGCMCDRPTALRHADSTVALYREHAGVDVAERVGRVAGKLLGLVLGLLWATLRWVFTRPSRRGPFPFLALGDFFVATGYATVTYSLAFDLDHVRALVKQVEPVALFKSRVPYAVYLLTCNLLAFPLGKLETARRNCHRLLHILATDRLSPIREMDRKTGEGGARYMLAVIGAMAQDEDAEAEFERLAALKLRFYELGILQARVGLHRLRGEEERALEYAARAEVLFVQLGAMWQLEALLPILSAFAYAFTRDVLGLKRMIEVLARLTREGYNFEAFLTLSRAEYHRERGELDASKAALERALGLLDPEEKLVHQPVTAALAETHLAMGHFARAAELSRQTIAMSDDREIQVPHSKLRGMRTLGLAQAASGDVAAACATLDGAIADAEPSGIPAIMGSLHEARARIALAGRDGAGFSLHLESMERWFRPTRNPVLIARCERLSALREPERAGDAALLAGADATLATTPEARRLAIRPTAAATATAGPTRAEPVPVFTSSSLLKVVSEDAVTLSTEHDPRMTSALLSGCRGSAERAARALELLVLATSGVSGYLYLVHERGLDLVAPAYGDEPPAAIDKAIRQLVADGVADDVPTVLGAREQVEASEAKWRPLLLRLTLLDRSTVVGAAAVVEGALPLENPDPRLIDEIARLLYQAGDVSTAGPVSSPVWSAGVSGER